MTKVIILNGPPNSGKDTIGEAIMELLRRDHNCKFSDIYHGQFKKVLLEILSTTLRISEHSLMQIYNNRELKDTPLAIFGGHSIREAMISISEDYIKPIFGKDYIGRMELSQIRIGKPKFAIYTDGGFIDEIRPLFADPLIELHIVQIHRDGCSFAGDSRGYLTGPEVCHCIYELQNNGSIKGAAESVLDGIGL